MKRRRLLIIFLSGILLVGCMIAIKSNMKQERQFDTIKLEKEPDGIFCSPYTEKLAVVTDGELTVYDSSGTGRNLDIGLYITMAYPLQDKIWVIDNKKNLYEVDDRKEKEINVSKVVLSGVTSFSCTPNGYNTDYSYGAIDEEGDVYVWGYNVDYQLGMDQGGVIGTPTKVDYVKNIKRIYFMDDITLLLSVEGEVYEAGIEGYSNEISDPYDSDYAPIYIKRFTIVDELFGARDFLRGFVNIAVFDDKIKTWTYGAYVQNREEKNIEREYMELGLQTFAFGGKLMLGMNQEGTIFYWGYDILNRPKDKREPWVLKPVRIKQIENAEMIYAGGVVGYVKKDLEIIILSK